MYVKFMNDNNREYLDPTWNQIEKSLRKLDGVNFSYIQLSQSKGDEEFLVLGGGNNGRYMCILYNGSEYYVVNPLESCDKDAETTIVKESDRNIYGFLNIDVILTISKTYFEKGKRDDKVVWKEY